MSFHSYPMQGSKSKDNFLINIEECTDFFKGQPTFQCNRFSFPCFFTGRLAETTIHTNIV